MTARVITTLAEAQSLDLAAIPARREPTAILMCPPDYFEVKDVKNAFMEGNIGRIDKTAARQQWDELKAAFERLGKQVFVIEAAPDLEDMVFSANQVLPGLDSEGRPYVVLSLMRHESRRKEVAHYRKWFESRGYRIIEFSRDDILFEGQGDTLWHPGKQLLWGGHGHRTSLEAYQDLSEMLNVPVIALHLHTQEFYHLDTCFCLLDSNSVLVYSEAFTPEGMKLIRHFFPRVIEANQRDAGMAFACNALVLDDKYVVIQRGANDTVKKLSAAGFEIVEVETSEYIKSGGSVFCMKMMIY
ncbi:MAG: arginine deiminase family protein [Acidobacteriota bacterium]